MINAAIYPLILCLVSGVISFALKSKPVIQKSITLISTIIFVMITLWLIIITKQQGYIFLNLGNYPTTIAISFVIDGLSALMLLLTALIAFAVALYAIIDDTISVNGAFYPPFWFMLSGITGIFCTGDLFNLFVWFEVMIAASLVMISLSNEKGILEGTLHYVALNMLATFILLTSIALLYGCFGTLNIGLMAERLHEIPNSMAVTTALILLAVSFSIKSALFPFFFWLPASYHLTNVSSAAVFAGLLTKVGVYLLIRFDTLFLTTTDFFSEGLLIISLLTMLTGVFGAMSDFHIRRIMAFHIISQVGYMTLGLAIGTTAALAAALFYVMHHILVKTNLFLLSGILLRFSGKNDVRQMGGFFRNKPFVAALFLIPAFSLAGVPPLSGFWAKYLIVKESLSTHHWITASIALLVGFCTLYSMIKVWRYTFWSPLKHPLVKMGIKQQIVCYIPVICLAFLTILIGFFPQSCYWFIYKTANQLTQPTCYTQAVTGGELCPF